MYDGCISPHRAPRGFVAGVDLFGEECTVDAGGGPPVSVPGDEVDVLSPDGKRVGFATSDLPSFGIHGSVGVMANTGAAPRLLWTFDGSGLALAWSSDGKRLAVEASGVGFAPGLYVVDVSTGTHKWLTGLTDGPLAWDPGGGNVAFATDGAVPQVKVVSVKSGEVRTLRSDPPANSSVPTLSWAPDGTSILVSFVGEPGTSEIQQLDPGGGPPRVLLMGSAVPGSAHPTGNDYVGAIFAPDGRHIAVAVGCDETGGDPLGTSSCQGSIDVADLKGAGLRPVVSGYIQDLRLVCWVREPANVANPVPVSNPFGH